MSPGARDRVLRLVAAARRIADPADPLGQEARATLPHATGLSPENVGRCLSECLETEPSEAELDALLRSVPEAPRAHVILSASVFVAAHRAIALALATSPRPRVRPSRREPEMVRLLAAAAPGLFELARELSPAPGDHVFAYGSDASLQAIAGGLPPGVVLHAHGSGIGLVLLDVGAPEVVSRETEVAAAVARDVVRFDQRGCLSPRVVVASGPREAARAFAGTLATALARLEREIPLGVVHPEERADGRCFRDTWLVAGDLFPAGSGAVSFDGAEGPLRIPPAPRNVHVRWTPDPALVARELAPLVTAVAAVGSESFRIRASSLLPGARLARAGDLQRPPFDGPVDRRALQKTTSSR